MGVEHPGRLVGILFADVLMLLYISGWCFFWWRVVILLVMSGARTPNNSTYTWIWNRVEIMALQKLARLAKRTNTHAHPRHVRERERRRKNIVEQICCFILLHSIYVEMKKFSDV